MWGSEVRSGSTDANRNTLIVAGSQEIIQALLRFPIVETILGALAPTLPVPMLSSLLRTLNIIMQRRPTPTVLENFPQLAPTLTQLISGRTTPLAIVDQCCRLIVLIIVDNSSNVQVFVKSLVARVSLHMRQTKPTAVPLESALIALAHVIRMSEYSGLLMNDVIECQELGLRIESKVFLDNLIKLTRNQDKAIRVGAVSALADIRELSRDIAQREYLGKPLLPTLFPLLGVDNKDPQVYKAMILVCRDDSEAVKTAFEAGVIAKICEVVGTADTKKWTNSELISSSILVLVAFCMRDEACRMAVMDGNVIGKVENFFSLSGENPISSAGIGLRKVKLASCHLVRALARSVSLLRDGLVSEKIVDGMQELLSKPQDVIVQAYEQAYGDAGMAQTDRDYWLVQELDLKTAVMAAVCNIVPEFSSCQQLLLDRGFLEMIAEGAKSKHGPLRLNSVWAFKHAVYELEPSECVKLIRLLTPKYLLTLCNDEESHIQEQAFGAIRNIMCGGDLAAIELTLEEMGPQQAMNMFESRLNKAAQFIQNEPEISAESKGIRKETLASLAAHENQVALHIIYAIANMAMHSTTLRSLILSQDALLTQIPSFFSHSVNDIRSGCAWVAINLVWHNDHSSLALSHQDQTHRQPPPHAAGALKLCKLGFQAGLKKTLSDPCLDVRERTAFAYECITKALDWDT